MDVDNSVFTSGDRELHRRVYDAFKDGGGSELVISSIRNEVVESHNKVSTFIVAFSKILTIREHEHKSAEWISFNKVLKDQKHLKRTDRAKWEIRLEQLAFISMQWSPEVASDYGWTTGVLSRDKVQKLYQCAKKYTRFKEDFIPHINLMQWLQRCAEVEVLDTLRTPYQQESDGDFNEQHLKILVQLHKSRKVFEFGMQILLHSTAKSYEREILTWIDSTDSHVSLPGRTFDLRSTRSTHWKLLLLRFDRNGLLVKRDSVLGRAPEVGSLSHGRSGTTTTEVRSEVHRESVHRTDSVTEEFAGSREEAEQTAVGELVGSGDPQLSSIQSTLATGAVLNKAKDRKTAGTRSSKNVQTGTDSRFGNCPQDCLCHECQELESFFEMIQSDALKSNAPSIHKVRHHWLNSAKWASRNNIRDSEQDDVLEPEVRYLDEIEFQHLAEVRTGLKGPIVIRKKSQDRTTQEVNTAQTVRHDSCSTDESETLLSLLEDKQADVCCVLRTSLHVQNPAFMFLSRFSLLQRASMRTFDPVTDSDKIDCYCNEATHTAYVANGLSRVRVETTGAFSGPHMSAFGGSWFRTLVGRRLCIFAEETGLTKIPYSGWQPSTRARLVLLQPNDVMIMPPGFVFANLTVKPSATLEGNFWDERDIDRYLKATRMARRSPILASEVPLCAIRRGLSGYSIISKRNNSQRKPQKRSAGQYDDHRSRRDSSRSPCRDSTAELIAVDVGLTDSRRPRLGPNGRNDPCYSRGPHEAQGSCERHSKRVCFRG